MADPILESSLKTRTNTIYCDIFCYKIKKLTNSGVPKTAASLFPFSCVTFLIDCIDSLTREVLLKGKAQCS